MSYQNIKLISYKKYQNIEISKLSIIKLIKISKLSHIKIIVRNLISKKEPHKEKGSSKEPHR